MGRRILHLRNGGPGFPRDLKRFCEGATPRWEITDDGALLDISGTDRLHGPGLDGATSLCLRAGGATGGAGPTVLAARLASRLAHRWGGGVYVVDEGSVRAFLAVFPIRFLPALPREVDRLRQLGVRTCGDLQAVSRPLLKAVFGARGWELADEAMGVSGRSLRRRTVVGRDETSGLDLVTGIRLSRPLNDVPAERALRRGLAMRALARCSHGPADRKTWRLTVVRPGIGNDQSYARAPDHGGWSAWVGLLEILWRRLPRRRTGLVGAELHASPARKGGGRQETLFEEDRRDRRLAETLARLEGVIGVAGEDLLQGWGGRWFGPGEEQSPKRRGLVDGGGPSR